MKTVTAKEFQSRQSAIMKEVAAGKSYQVTFHRKPFVVLSPAKKKTSSKPKPGSREAFLESLKHTVAAKHLPEKIDYKATRHQDMRKRYGI